MNTTQTDEAKALEKIDLLAGWHWHFDGVKDAKTVILRKPDGTGGCAVTWVHVAEEMAKAFQDELSTLRTQLADAQKQLAAVCEAGQEVVNRWDSPSWKWDDEHTGNKVRRLRDAIAATRQPTCSHNYEDVGNQGRKECSKCGHSTWATRQPTQDKGDE